MAQHTPFDINTLLLTANPDDWRWSNLGYWANARDYGQACQQLALLHGQAVDLQAGQHLLELGCGYGAALALWQQQFQVSQIDALEYRPHCVEQIQAQQYPALARVCQGRFDRPLKAPLAGQHYDAVLCVDAAYHAQSLEQFLALIASALKPSGQFAFSTLLLASTYSDYPWQQRAGIRAALALARVNRMAVLSEVQLLKIAQEQGLTVKLQSLTEHVFSGFAAWIALRESQLSQQQKRGADWQKIYWTARFCRYLSQHPLLDYVLVSGQVDTHC
ncbi:class I SAM-dependent methyltransferase [Agitococcus lubricus]|uniref:Methyltransferase family protein n=1 Tax=Agitococcus lubricus TaxID=1077255 RepID=A0A2T5J278_9GAMM|nr:class I SAM-dependent methyltransferase [Agitococcus lubricus]PTQ90443.1 methyltransferase family protein [Agitococcus lubricus]